MLEITNLAVKYGEKTVYDGFSLQVDPTSFTCVLGESGCGKTTLLNAIAGLTPYSGQISKLKCACVFQTPRLVPNLTLLNNLTLIGADADKAKAMLDRVGLSGRENDYPFRLSGGEAQRVSLCRAFLYPADILLLDEPFSSLDLKTKLSVMELLRGMLKEGGMGALMVTHDVDEALYLADRIVVVADGKILADYRNGEGRNLPFCAPCALRGKIFQTLLK